jgi:hypothetical protein
VQDGIQELRWIARAGLERDLPAELPSDYLAHQESIARSSDTEIRPMLNFFRQENQAIELPLTITNSILATPTSAKLSPEEIKKLVDVRWQLSMLTHEGHSLNELLHLTFTVSDETNFNIVKSNHAGTLRMYGRRANFLLKYVRTALKDLEARGKKTK